MEFLKYLVSKNFWKQVLFMLLITLGLVIVLRVSLGFVTRHGQKVRVPDFTGKTLSELEEWKSMYDFRFVVRDSSFAPHLLPGSVLSQIPVPGSYVKEGRTFYLVVTSVNKPYVMIPNLVDRSLRQATSVLESYRIRRGQIIYVPSFAANAVVRLLQNGRELREGDSVQVGSVVDLEVGNGKGFDKVYVQYRDSIKQARQNLLDSMIMEELYSEEMEQEDEDEI